MTTDEQRCPLDEPKVVHRSCLSMANRWALSDDEVTGLLGDAGWREGDLTSEAATRLRLLLDVDALLEALIPEGGVAAWIRVPNLAFVGEETPILAMSRGGHVVRGVRNVLEEMGMAS